jgi:hypothetical protein
MPARANLPASDPAVVPNTVTTITKIPPSTLKKFLADGVEQPECIICGDVYGSRHVAVQIKECGHQFGEPCLKKWLKQNNTEGTCPMCRDVLFRAPPPPIPANFQTVAPPPLSSQTFCEYYRYGDNLERSTVYGFMEALWHSIYYIDPPEGQRYPSLHQISGAIIQAFEVTNVLSVAERPDFDPRRSLTDDCNDHEHFSLSPYIYHARHNDFSFPDECPVTGFANTLCKLATFCTTDELPSKAAWRAMLFYNVYSPTEFPVLSWTELRDAVWSLYDPLGTGVARDYQCAPLYLFLWLMDKHCTKQLSGAGASQYRSGNVANLLEHLECGFPDAVPETRDRETRFFLSAAHYALRLSGIHESSGRGPRAQRLMNHKTDPEQLKRDVEEVWLEAVNNVPR